MHLLVIDSIAVDEVLARLLGDRDETIDALHRPGHVALAELDVGGKMELGKEMVRQIVYRDRKPRRADVRTGKRGGMNDVDPLLPRGTPAIAERGKRPSVLPEILTVGHRDVTADAILRMDEIAEARIQKEFVLRFESR